MTYKKIVKSTGEGISQNSRNELIAVAKGIGIIIVVWGHCTFGYDWMSLFISSFHMPLFFYLSGYFFKDNNYLTPKRFCLKKVKTLYWTFLKWTIPVFLFHNVFVQTGIYNSDYLLFTDLLKGCCHITIAMIGTDVLSGGVWFIRDLFIGYCFLSLGGYCLSKIGCIKSNLIMFILMFLSLIIAYTGFQLPKGLLGYATFLAMAIICMGYFYHAYIERFVAKANSTVTGGVLLFIISLSLLLRFSLNMPFMSMHSEITLIAPFILVSFIGLIMVLSLSSLLIRIKMLKSILLYMGNNSLYIYLGHFMAFKCVNILLVCSLGIDHRLIGEFYIDKYFGTFPLYIILGCAIPLLVHYLWLKYVTPHFDFDKRVFAIMRNAINYIRK